MPNVAMIQSPLPPPRPSPPKPSWCAKLIGVLVSLSLGGVFGWTLVSSIEWHHLPKAFIPFELLAEGVLIPVACLAAIALHEGGHLFAGWLQGGRFLLYMVGPIKLHRTPSGLRMCRNRGVNVLGGLAMSVLPHEGSVVSATRGLVAGGPVASLVSSLTAFVGWTMLNKVSHRLSPNPILSFTMDFVLWLAIFSGFSFFISAVPYQTRGLKSDGKRFLDLLGTGPAVRQERSLLALTFALMSGIRPRELNPHLVAESLKLGDGSANDIWARHIAASHASDLGDVAGEQGYLDAVMRKEEVLPKFIADTVRASYAILIATNWGEPSAARAWLESAGTVEWDPSTRLTGEAAVLLAEGNRKAALETARKALKALDQKTALVRDQAQFETLHRLLEAATTDPPATSIQRA